MGLIDFSFWDNYKNVIEALSGGKNTVLFDDQNLPSVMVRIPKFKFTDVGLSKPGSAPSDYMPAFNVNSAGESGVVPCIFIGKYQSYVYNSRAYSLPYKDPTININFDDSKSRCTTKGSGWHLMTNAEWGAIAQWSRENGTMPRGNNNYIEDIAEPHESCVPTQTGVVKGTSGIARSYTGSGPDTWNHDHNAYGIADLNGNVWEWIDGLKIDAGVAKIMTHDGTSSGYPGNTFIMSEANWKNTSVNITTGHTTSHKILTLKTGDDWTGLVIPATSDVTGSATYGNDGFWFVSTSERMLLRGANWGAGLAAGIFALSLEDLRSNTGTTRGFRVAFISL